MYGVFLLRDIFLREKENMEMTKLAADLKMEGCTLYLLSNIYIRKSDFYKEKFRFLKLFDNLYFSSDTGFVKPDPRAFLCVLEDNDLKPEEVIFIDDSKQNIAAAQSLGIESYLFVDAKDTRARLKAAFS